MNNNPNNESQNRNLLVAIILMMLVMFFANKFLVDRSVVEKNEKSESITKDELDTIVSEKTTRDDAIKNTDRVSISNDCMSISMNKTNCIVDDVSLKKYAQDVGSDKRKTILNPNTCKDAYYFDRQYILFNPKTKDINDKLQATWQYVGDRDGSAVFFGRIGEFEIERIISLDDMYMISIKDNVKNTGDQDGCLISRDILHRDSPEIQNSGAVHQGALYNVNGRVFDRAYRKIKHGERFDKCFWVGYVDVYFACLMISDGGSQMNLRLPCKDCYECVLLGKKNIGKNDRKSFESKIYVGPKDMKVLHHYQKTCKVDKFEKVIDFGWFGFATKPLMILIDFLSGVIHNIAILIILLTIIMRFLTYPLSKKSLLAALKMRSIQPKIQSINQIYSDDPAKRAYEIMRVYRESDVKPMASLTPILIQAPIIFCLYKVFCNSIQMRHASFLWIKDMSQHDMCYIANLFGLLDFTPPSILQIGVWPLLMAALMVFQQKLSGSEYSAPKGSPEAQMQKNMSFIMPTILLIMTRHISASVVFYWTVSSVIGIIQTRLFNKKYNQQNNAQVLYAK